MQNDVINKRFRLMLLYSDSIEKRCKNNSYRLQLWNKEIHVKLDLTRIWSTLFLEIFSIYSKLKSIFNIKSLEFSALILNKDAYETFYSLPHWNMFCYERTCNTTLFMYFKDKNAMVRSFLMNINIVRKSIQWQAYCKSNL